MQDCFTEHNVKRFWGKDGVLKSACDLLHNNPRAVLSGHARGGSQVSFVGAPRMAVNRCGRLVNPALPSATCRAPAAASGARRLNQRPV